MFLPDVQLNSTYLYYDMSALRQRPAGYSTTAPRPAFRTARRLRPLTCGTWSREVTRLGIRYVAVHDGLYEQFYPRCLGRAQAALRGHGFRLLAREGQVKVWTNRA